MATSRRRPNRSRGRSGQPLWAVLVLAAMTVSVLAAAGVGASPRERSLRALSPQQVNRSMACVSGLPEGEAVVGALDGTVSTTRTARDGVVGLVRKGAPLVVRTSRAGSSGSYASQSARTRDWYAAQPCPEPAAQRWFLGAGGSQLHSSVLTLTNSRSAEAVVDITVWGPKGEVPAPGLRGVTVGGAPLRIDLTRVAPAVGDLALSVTSVRGLVSASLVDTRSASAATRGVTEFLPGHEEPSKQVVLGGLGVDGKGRTAKARRSLLLLNTSETSAVVRLDLIGKSGTFTSTGLDTVSAPPGQVVNVPLPDADFGEVLGVRVTSPEPVVAGLRSEPGKDMVHASSLHELGGKAVLGVPPGGTGVVRLLNPTSDPLGPVGVRMLDARGRLLEETSVSLAAGAGKQVPPRSLRRKTRVVVITGGGAARAVLELRAPTGGASLPFVAAPGGARVPAVYADPAGSP